MRNRILNDSKEAASYVKKHVSDRGKFLLAADVEVTTPNFADMPLGSDLSTRNIQQTYRPKLHNKAERRFAEAIVTKVEKHRVKLLREQDKNLVVLLLRMVKTKPKSNTLNFDFENKRET